MFENRPTQPPCGERERNDVCWCSAKVLCFLFALLLATIGVILGAVFAAAILGALAAVIVLAVVLAILVIAVLIYRWCRCSWRL
jgi:membrane protein YdbS with pleckstrin-like domain